MSCLFYLDGYRAGDRGHSELALHPLCFVVSDNWCCSVHGQLNSRVCCEESSGQCLCCVTVPQPEIFAPPLQLNCWCVVVDDVGQVGVAGCLVMGAGQVGDRGSYLVVSTTLTASVVEPPVSVCQIRRGSKLRSAPARSTLAGMSTASPAVAGDT